MLPPVAAASTVRRARSERLWEYTERDVLQYYPRLDKVTLFTENVSDCGSLAEGVQCLHQVSGFPRYTEVWRRLMLARYSRHAFERRPVAWLPEQAQISNRSVRAQLDVCEWLQTNGQLHHTWQVFIDETYALRFDSLERVKYGQ
jgi:hypothetical protein